MSSRPEPISGTIGERIRVILGDNGNEWLLLLNKDNGERKWQEQYWSSIPSAVSKQINNCIKKDRRVIKVDFNSDGAWYINAEKYDGTGGHHWWGGTNAPIENFGVNKSTQVYFGTVDDYYNGVEEETYVLLKGSNGYSLSDNLPQQATDCLEQCNKRRGTINFIRLFHENKYFISHDRGTDWELGNEHIDNILRNTSHVNDVALAKDGSWIIINDNDFESSTGVDVSLERNIKNFFSDQRRYKSERDAEIRQYDQEQTRLAQEARERAQQEARLQREREELERRERVETEAEEARKRAIEAEKARKEAEEREILKQQSLFKKALIKRVTDEANDIADAEKSIEKRKKSLKQSLEILPESERPNVSMECGNSSKNVCVVCQHENAVMAIVPCGHMCLCEECSSSVLSNSQQCPLCRAPIEKILKIYFGNS